jgi:isocitrate dehydrogenase
MVKVVRNKTVTYDFARLMEGAHEVSTSEFGNQLISNM